MACSYIFHGDSAETGFYDLFFDLYERDLVYAAVYDQELLRYIYAS